MREKKLLRAKNKFLGNSKNKKLVAKTKEFNLILMYANTTNNNNYLICFELDNKSSNPKESSK